jgi:hypothetical protein
VHRGRRRAESAHLPDEALHVCPPQRADLPLAQQGEDVGLERVLIGPDGLRLIGLPASLEDRAGAHPGDQCRAGLLDGRRRRRPQPPAANRHGRLLLPGERLRPARRPCGADLPSARIAHLAPVVRRAVAPLSAPGRAVVGVPFLDTHRPAAVNGPAEAPSFVIASAASRRRYRPSPAVGMSLGLRSRTMRDAGFGARAGQITYSAISSTARLSSSTGNSRLRPRRTTRRCGRKCSTKNSSLHPSEAHASCWVSAMRGTGSITGPGSASDIGVGRVLRRTKTSCSAR